MTDRLRFEGIEELLTRLFINEECSAYLHPTDVGERDTVCEDWTQFKL